MKRIISFLIFIFVLALFPGYAGAATKISPILPSSGSSNYNSHTTLLQWKSFPGLQYKIQVRANNNSFTDSDTFTNTLTEGSIMADEIIIAGSAVIKNDGRTYYWRVKTTEEGAVWSKAYSFKTIGSIQAATILYPKLVKNVPPVINENTGNFNFSWRNPSGYAYSLIEFYVAEKQGLVWKCLSDQAITSKIPVKTDKLSSKLLVQYSLGDGDYCWKVVSYNNAEGRNVSEPGFFSYRMQSVDAGIVSDPLFAQAKLGKLILYWSKIFPSFYGGEIYSLRLSTSPTMDASKRIEVEDISYNYYVSGEGSAAWNFVKANAGKDIYWQVFSGANWSKIAKFKAQL